MLLPKAPRPSRLKDIAFVITPFAIVKPQIALLLVVAIALELAFFTLALDALFFGFFFSTNFQVVGRTQELEYFR